MNKINEFLWWCSGTDIEMLKKTPSESSKYFGIGGMVLFTGIFAALSSGYAFNLVFDNIYSSIALGILWGLTIFNLDRYIVSGMKKRNNRWREISIALPRFVLAVVIAVVISKPLELKIFEKEIQSELQTIKLEKQLALDSAVDLRYEESLSTLRQENLSIVENLREKETQRNLLRDIARREADGTGGTGRRNAGPIYRIKKQNADNVDHELDLLRQSGELAISENKIKLDSIHSRISKEKIANIITWNGLAGRLDALKRLTLKSEAIYWANLFILLLFIVIETAPVIVKLLADKGPHDYLSMENDFNYKSEVLLNISQKREKTLKKGKLLNENSLGWLKRELWGEI